MYEKTGDSQAVEELISEMCEYFKEALRGECLEGAFRWVEWPGGDSEFFDPDRQSQIIANEVYDAIESYIERRQEDRSREILRLRRLFSMKKSKRVYYSRAPRARRERRSSRRSRSSFVATFSHSEADSGGGGDGSGDGDGDGQSDSHHVGTGHEARVNVVVDSQQNKSIEEPGIAARSDALAVAGFFVPFERAEVAA
ncbi:hypothetical protein [Pyramidobacter sp. C12-8]|uniref:hypothetical protein n=1 Tax=Pyramidobacter sp. C12-8 TaxID=1943580 RepID=UPI001439C2E2|nr:hypothetical protein [Pyramidobacter sp. C12-8]